uniref:Ig-like domain-containing protein n=1 Tax=Oryzias sinensis TaxID=183150 RepID=A0A8C7XM22_9TELE
ARMFFSCCTVVQSGGVLLGSSTILPCHINTNDRLSQITWQRTIKGKALDDVFLTIQPTIGPSYKLKETQHANGTTTTWSTLLGKPGREMNGQLVKCVISSEAMKEEILETNIQVHYSPGEVKVTERSTDSFECETEANPNATFTWTRAGQSLPESIRVEGGVLQFPSKNNDLSGLYQCEAGNRFGKPALPCRDTTFFVTKPNPGPLRGPPACFIKVRRRRSSKALGCIDLSNLSRCVCILCCCLSELLHRDVLELSFSLLGLIKFSSIHSFSEMTS